MIHLHKATNGQFYMLIKAKNGRITWRQSETYKRRAGAYKALLSALNSLHAAAGLRPFAGAIKYIDHTQK